MHIGNRTGQLRNEARMESRLTKYVKEQRSQWEMDAWTMMRCRREDGCNVPETGSWMGSGMSSGGGGLYTGPGHSAVRTVQCALSKAKTIRVH